MQMKLMFIFGILFAFGQFYLGILSGLLVRRFIRSEAMESVILLIIAVAMVAPPILALFMLFVLKDDTTIIVGQLTLLFFAGVYLAVSHNQGDGPKKRHRRKTHERVALVGRKLKVLPAPAQIFACCLTGGLLLRLVLS